jgi:midasin (ATPase involved in ribosome maturation)
VVLNLSQQTDSSDLLGGFRPVEARDALAPLLPAFSDLVSSLEHVHRGHMCMCGMNTCNAWACIHKDCRDVAN